MNTLYYGDNLNILREYIEAESVDLTIGYARLVPTHTVSPRS
jgi:hypothetical protein